MDVWRAKADDERKEQHAAAVADKAKARASKTEATKKKLQAKDKITRDAAERERQEALRDLAEANERARETSSAPPFNSDVQTKLQPPSMLRAMADSLSINLRQGHTIKKLVEQSLKELDPIVDNISPLMAQEIIKANEALITQLQAMNAKLTGKRSFVVHPGGLSDADGGAP